MADREKVFDAIRNCVTEPKCKDKNCPWKEDCEKIGCKRTTVPVTLLLDTLNLLKEQPQWISVKDSRPKDQKPVIVYVPPHTNRYGDEFIGYVGMAYYTYSVNGGYWCGTDGNLYGAIGAIAAPSHWMPLPEPPEEVKWNG